MTEVVSLRGGVVIRPEPNQSCIDACREMLEMAESGEIVGFVGAMMYGDRSAAYRINGNIDHYRLLGAIECAKARLMADVLENDK